MPAVYFFENKLTVFGGGTAVYTGGRRTAEEWDGTNWNYAQNSLVKDFKFGRSVQVICPAGN